MPDVSDAPRGIGPRQTRGHATPMSVIGLVPRSVRLDLEPCQLAGLRDELLTSIEAQSGSMREDHERRGSLNRNVLRDAGEEILDHSKLLRAIADDDAAYGDGSVSITASMEIAYELVRGCAHNAAARLLELVGEHNSDRTELLRASAASQHGRPHSSTYATSTRKDPTTTDGDERRPLIRASGPWQP